ncbi:MAG: hypothetical protein JEZ11_00965 [Desulfobacterales bacterium]|nr:hypothetical protein [Desulfobacterales bacterium]
MSLSIDKPRLDNLANEIWKSAERLRGESLIHKSVTGKRRITEADLTRVQGARAELEETS